MSRPAVIAASGAVILTVALVMMLTDGRDDRDGGVEALGVVTTGYGVLQGPDILIVSVKSPTGDRTVEISARDLLPVGSEVRLRIDPKDPARARLAGDQTSNNAPTGRDIIAVIAAVAGGAALLSALVVLASGAIRTAEA